MADKRVIAIVGATGAQGGGLARAIAADTSGSFRARAITRNPHSEAAQELAKLGVELVSGNADDPTSMERAFSGAWGAFCVTFYWDHFSPEKELAQAANLARAAKAAGVKHAIWSTLEDTRRFMALDDPRMPTLLGRYKVPHFDAKGEADGLFETLGPPTTYLLTSFYWDNFITFGMGPKRGQDGTLELMLPMGEAKLPGIAAEDIGRCAYGIFREDGALAGARIGVAGEHLTGAEMAAGLGRALSEEVRYRAVPPAVYRSFGFPGADDLGNMFQFKQEFESAFCGVRDVERSRSLNPSLQSFETWLQRNAGRIAVEGRAAGA